RGSVRRPTGSVPRHGPRPCSRSSACRRPAGPPPCDRHGAADRAGDARSGAARISRSDRQHRSSEWLAAPQRRSTSTMSTRPSPPITRPRSAAPTRTSSSGPRRVDFSVTRTASGSSTMPRTRWSRASARELMSGLVVRRGLGVLGGLALGRSLLGTRCDLGGLGLVSGLGLLRTLTGLRGGLVGVGDELLGGLLRLGTLHGAGDVALALELRPVAGDL